MKSGKARPPGDASEEMSALIATLHETGQRLEELTAGEVDSVVDRSGRTLLMRGVQEQLRRVESTKQAAILSALPAHIALLDSGGSIVSVNEAWKHFGIENALHYPGHAVGTNYLDICDRAEGEHSAEAHRAAAGIRSVVEDSAKCFSLEYPCHSPEEQRWFLMTVTPLAGAPPNGVVVMHLNITERRRGEDDLRRFAAAMDAIADAVLLVDRASMRFVHVNDAACRYMGLTREQLLALDPWVSASMSRMALEQVYDAAIANGADPIPQEMPFRGRDGSNSWIEVRRHALRSRDNWIIVTLLRDITERKQATRNLLESEARFRSLTMLSSDWFWEQDAEHRFIGFSGGEGVKGWGPDQNNAIGLHRWDLGGVIPISCSWEEHKEVLDTHKPFRNFEYQRILGDGRLQYVEASGEPVFDAGGGFTGYRGVATEITKRKLAERELQRQQSELRVLFDLMPAMIWFKDTQNGILRVNSRVAKAAGRTVAEIEGKPSRDIYPLDAARFYADDLEVILSGTPKLGYVESLGGPNGQESWVQTDKVPYFDHDGKVMGIVVMAQDITERKHAEHDLQRFRAAMDSSGDGIVLVDRATMRYVDVNQTLCDLVGYTRQELICMTPMDLFGTEREVLERDYDAIIADSTHRALLVEGHYRHKNGSLIPIETRRRAFHAGEGWIIVGSARDITDRKKAEGRILYLNRVYAMLSGINSLIVRVRDRDELFSEVCRIAVREGGFRMTWIGVLDRDAAKIVQIATAGGSRELQNSVHDLFTSSEGSLRGNTLTARAMREKRPALSNDTQNDPAVLFGGRNVAFGVRSMAALPLVVSDKAVGVFVLYSDEIEFFRTEEMKQLAELAANIAFAIDHIEKRDRLEYLAYHDPLTGLANRALFHERLDQTVVGERERGRKFALVFLDIERFKTINDSLGREAGDALIKAIAERTANLVDAGRLARFDADHFAVMIPDLQSDEEVARRIEQRMEDVFGPPFRIRDTDLRISAKFGIAMFPDDGADADTLFRNAEAALKKAKSGGDRYLFYTQAMNERVAEKLSLENQLRQALEKNEFVLHYQPKVNLDSGLLTGCEALIRWNDPRTGLVPPGRFIPILEETGLINEVGRWALRQAIEDYLRWCKAGLPGVRIAVNVSPLQLRNHGFVDEIARNIGVDANAAAGLELEITESLIMEDVKLSIETLRAIRAMGVTIAIDDFGTGFSSLSYLAKLPVTTLKIDRSFVIDMTAGPEGLALVSTIISLAHSLKLKVVAEGVETEEQSRILRLLRCDEMQGYLFSKPVPANIFEEKFLRRPPDDAARAATPPAAAEGDPGRSL
jgi:diguanylate cyclase (GGDEF)-like protein/PAS domain S-box-containing protein